MPPPRPWLDASWSRVLLLRCMGVGAGLPPHTRCMQTNTSRTLAARLTRSRCGELQAQNVVGTDTFVSFVNTLLATQPRVAARLRGYRHVLVDEVQDNDRSQYNFVRHLSDGGSSIFFVGDPNQCIYEFRGADVRALQRRGCLLSALPPMRQPCARLQPVYCVVCGAVTPASALAWWRVCGFVPCSGRGCGTAGARGERGCRGASSGRSASSTTPPSRASSSPRTTAPSRASCAPRAPCCAPPSPAPSRCPHPCASPTSHRSLPTVKTLTCVLHLSPLRVCVCAFAHTPP